MPHKKEFSKAKAEAKICLHSTRFILKYMCMKKLLLCAVCIMTLCFLFGCSGADFSDIKILAEDVSEVPAGEYTLRYSIPDYEEYNSLFSLSVSVTVFDQNNELVEVSNNRTFVVVEDMTYSVTVSVSATIDDEHKLTAKTFKVTAVKTPLTVTFWVGPKEHIKKTVPYGSSLDISDFAKIPDMYTKTGTGVTQTITSKKWVITRDGVESDLTQADLDCITEDLTIKAVYTYHITYNTITLEFDNGPNATETPSISQTCGTSIAMPELPTKEGYVFDGWYYDKEFTEKFSWKNTTNVTSDAVLYAKWVKNDPEYEQYFGYTLAVDNYGYKYCEVFLDRTTNYPAEIVIPAGINNYPVKAFGYYDPKDFSYQTLGAFENSSIVSVVIPQEFTYYRTKAFKNCASLASITFLGDVATRLGDQTFFGCVALEEIVLPDSLTRLGTETFRKCTSLKNIRLPKSLTTIDTSCFDDCDALEAIAIPDSVSSINSAFENCTSLTEITFCAESSLTFLAEDAFKGCTSLKTITLPAAMNDSAVKEALDKLGITVSFYDKPVEE